MELKKSASSGSINISEEVIETIVETVLNEVPGVHSKAVRPFALADTLSGKALRKSIEISINADVATIDISVNVCYGCRLRTVAEQIQNRVKDTVQDMTGIAVGRVNIYIADIKKAD